MNKNATRQFPAPVEEVKASVTLNDRKTGATFSLNGKRYYVYVSANDPDHLTISAEDDALIIRSVASNVIRVK